MNHSITINPPEDLGFVLSHWGAISIIMYTISFIVVVFAIVEKTTVWKKIFNILIITSIPIIGCLAYIMMRVWRNRNIQKLV